MSDDAIGPREAFQLLADETRVAILVELAEAWSDDWPGVVAYAELMERVGAEDSGRFNYHLSKLVGRFVDRRADGYKANFDGLRMYRAIVAGTFTERPRVEPFDVGQACHVCDGDLRARYDEDMFTVACPDCDTAFFSASLPPRGFEGRSDAAVLRAAHHYSRRRVALAARGVCPWCAGRMDARLVDADESEVLAGPVEVGVEHACRACDGRLWTTVGERLLVESAVVALFDAAAVDLAERPVWELAFAATDYHTTVAARDPWEVGVDVPVGDDTHRVTVDADLRVTVD